MQKLIGTGTVLFLISLCFTNCKQVRNTPDFLEITERAENDPELRWKEEFDMLKNPITGKMPQGIREIELREAANMPLKEELIPNAGNIYSFQGPNNIGGRCRAVAYDVRFNGGSNRIMLAGGVSGGMFRSTDAGISWTRVSSLNDIHSVTCVAQDPRPGFQDTWYFGTGEASGNSAGGEGALYFGNGIFKSTDNGITWNRLPATAPGSQFTFDNRFDYVSKIAVNPINGHIYAGNNNCISLSTNGGTSWTIDLGAFEGNSGGNTDVIITSTGIIYASISGRFGASASNQGVWTKQAGTWTRIAGGGSPEWFNAGNSLGRIVLAVAPSNENTLYALYHNGTTSSCSGSPAAEAEFGVYDESTGTWVDISSNLPNEPGCLDGNDPFAVQGGYDLAIAVKPNNPNVVFIAGVNLYRSTDGFTSPTNVTRIGGYTSPNSYAFDQARHPDIHTLTFQPGSPDILVMGSDGGVSEANIGDGGVPSWVERNTNFNTLQYYYVAIDPTAGSTRFMGGSQDNGTMVRTFGNNSHTRVFSGDGVSVGISANNVQNYLGFQRGPVYRRTGNLAPFFHNGEITPPNLSADRLFVTLFHLDPDNSTILYYADHNKLYRNTNVDTVTILAQPANRMQEVSGVANSIGNAGIRCFATSRGTYDAATSKLYFGTNDGRVFRIDNPRNADVITNPTPITNGAGMPNGTIRAIAVNPRNADTIVAVYSNYGIQNIWFCGNATGPNPTWTVIEGNLSTPSIRSAAIILNGNLPEYYVGTSTGLYSTVALLGNNTVWAKEGADIIGNAVVVDIKYRISDNKLLIGTHGNGMFLTDEILPVQFGNFTGRWAGSKTLLSWYTLTETNNKGFDIERSEDGRTFKAIGFVAGKGQSQSRSDYTFTDANAPGRVLFYRIKQIDKNGMTAYSKVIKLSLDGQLLQLTSLVNPASTNLIFTFNEVPQQTIAASIIDGSGRVVLRQPLGSNNAQVFKLNIFNLPNGMYTLKLEGKTFSDNRRFIKQM